MKIGVVISVVSMAVTALIFAYGVIQGLEDDIGEIKDYAHENSERLARMEERLIATSRVVAADHSHGSGYGPYQEEVATDGP